MAITNYTSINVFYSVLWCYSFPYYEYKQICITIIINKNVIIYEY